MKIFSFKYYSYRNECVAVFTLDAGYLSAEAQKCFSVKIILAISQSISAHKTAGSELYKESPEDTPEQYIEYIRTHSGMDEP